MSCCPEPFTLLLIVPAVALAVGLTVFLVLSIALGCCCLYSNSTVTVVTAIACYATNVAYGF